MASYRLTRQLSAPGAFLEAWAGRVGERPVSLKRVVDSRPGLGERLVELTRTLRGPALPGVLEVGTDHDAVWVVTEATEGESLRWVMSTLARASGFIAPNEGLAVVARVAAALDGLHRAGNLHGDVCPSTIFVTTRGEVQVLDAGIAAAMGMQGEQGPYRSEVNSLAPEQLTGPATPASDVFRLGLLLYELAVGRPLWTGPSPGHLGQAAASWAGLTRERVKQVPEPWLTLLVTMLNAEPGARPSMEEVGAVLEQAVTLNGWGVTETDIARLFARAGQGRTSIYTGAVITGHELVLTALGPPPSAPSLTPPPGAVVARIATKKMTREELAAVRTETPVQGEALPPELQAAQLLVERGQLTRQQVQAAKEQAATSSQSLLAVLASLGADEDVLVATLSELTHTPSVGRKKLTDATPGPDALALLPLELSRATRAVPLGLKGGTQLMVAMADPMDLQAVAQLKAALGPRSLIAFRAGEVALADTRARLYTGATSSWTGELELAPRGATFDPLALISAPVAAALPVSELPTRVIDALLGLQGLRGAQAQQLVLLACGLTRRMGLPESDVALARLGAMALVTSALASNRLPHDVPKLVDVQQLVGFGTEADAFVEALHAFPARMPERPVVKAVVLAFAFAAHAGEARPAGARLGGALSSFRTRHQLAQPIFDLLSRELTG